jgi:hypothetical protein
MALLLQQPRHLLVAPAAMPAAMHQNEDCHLFAPEIRLLFLIGR